MLQAINDKAKGILGWIIIAFISVPFALWGIQEYLGNDKPNYIAKVNDSEISVREYDEALARHKERLKSMLGGELPDSPAFDSQMKKQVLEQLVSSRVLESSSLKAGFRISDELLANKIKTMEPFLQDGKFMVATYEQLLRSQGMSVAEFEYLMRRDLLTQQLQNGVIQSSIVGKSTFELVNRLQNQSRDISYLLIKQASYHNSITLTDSEIEQYYSNNQNRYMYPEQVSVSYIEFKGDHLASNIPVDEEAVRRAYDEYVAVISEQEERQARHILIQLDESADETLKAEKKKKAESILARLQAGESFDKLARAESDDKGSASKGGDLGWINRGMMVPDFEDALYKLKKNETSGVIQTGFGFHIIRLDDIKATQAESFEAKKQEIIAQVKQSEIDNLFYERSELMASMAYENDQTLQPAADALGIKIQQSGFFSRTSGQGLASNDAVRSAAFSEAVLKGGHNSEVIELDKNHIIVLRLDEHKTAKPKALQEVRASVEMALRMQKAKQKAQAAGLQAMADLQQLKSLEAFDKSKHYELNNPGFIKRDYAEADIAIVKAAFEMPKPEGNEPSFTSIDLNNGDVVVIQLAAVNEPSSSDATADLSKVRQQIETEIANQEMLAILSYLKSQSEIVRAANP
ncbi:MAG: SurA N-terminal domain-containing protein [Gammaproteobacteria bacterium]|nr:SurA N-terminal domain-containing protein [Gammaproteobacteria bacterium]MCW8910220.1 SurA N-terminal domain-containing protein [Gammaproteobacteria bacterium]MCW9005904.1 SurA N-terminal domain-containing protein [Gammaproteobacteria bacterium]